MTPLIKLTQALGLVLAFVASNAAAHEVTVGDLTVVHPQARPNLPNRPTAAYMVIANDGEVADRLLSASSPAFRAVEIHTTMKHGEVMKMIPVEAVEIPPGDAAVLEPGGLHLMLFDGAERHKIGDEFPLNLTFERAGDVQVNVKVEKIKAGEGAHAHHGHGSGHSGHGTASD